MAPRSPRHRLPEDPLEHRIAPCLVVFPGEGNEDVRLDHEVVVLEVWRQPRRHQDRKLRIGKPEQLTQFANPAWRQHGRLPGQGRLRLASEAKGRQRAAILDRLVECDEQAPLSTVTLAVTELAEFALDVACTEACARLDTDHGAPLTAEGARAQLWVMGMGKLGAHELNLSSDIDLIFGYPEGGETEGVKRPLDNQEFFIRLGQRLIKALDAITVDGFVFRTDMRLRPYGSSGALVFSFNALEQYYQDQGRDWERYAMIKARTVAMAGGEGQIAARKLLGKMLQPFTYRQYIDFSAIESLREMKGLIARQVQRKGMNLDVKLGEGGIREVEFVVQVFQLIRGGRDARLRKRKVPVLLPFLEQENYLPPGAGSALLEAYIFLRNTEHAIQGYQDKQTQSLPVDPVGQLRLAAHQHHPHTFDGQTGRRAQVHVGAARERPVADQVAVRQRREEVAQVGGVGGESPLEVHIGRLEAIARRLQQLGFRRQALHAAVLGFTHPVTGDQLRFASDLPHDMRELIDETGHSDR